MTLISIITWILFGCAAAVWSKSRGRSPVAWFIIGSVFGIFGLILLLFLPSAASREKEGPEVMVDDKPVRQEEFFPAIDWFYLDLEKKTCGPVSFREMKGLWSKGLLTDRSWIWHESIVDWKRIEQVPNLATNLAAS